MERSDLAKETYDAEDADQAQNREPGEAQIRDQRQDTNGHHEGVEDVPERKLQTD